MILSGLAASGVPAVACGCPAGPVATLPHVAADDREGARRTTCHLQSLGRQRMAALLLQGRTRPAAVFVASDLLAAGALKSLRQHGLSVPADIAVGGFDDSSIARTTEPPLTTVRQPFDLVAAEMVELVLGAVSREPIDSVVLATRLVHRESA